MCISVRMYVYIYEYVCMCDLYACMYLIVFYNIRGCPTLHTQCTYMCTFVHKFIWSSAGRQAGRQAGIVGLLHFQSKSVPSRMT
jgi:hypothetical protein